MDQKMMKTLGMVIAGFVMGCFFLLKKAPKSPNISNDSSQQFDIKDEKKLKMKFSSYYFFVHSCH